MEEQEKRGGKAARVERKLKRDEQGNNKQAEKRDKTGEGKGKERGGGDEEEEEEEEEEKEEGREGGGSQPRP